MIKTTTSMKPTHSELTASEPRDDSLYPVTLQDVSQPIRSVRLVRLRPESGHNSFKARNLPYTAWRLLEDVIADVQNI